VFTVEKIEKIYRQHIATYKYR